MGVLGANVARRRRDDSVNEYRPMTRDPYFSLSNHDYTGAFSIIGYVLGPQKHQSYGNRRYDISLDRYKPNESYPAHVKYVNRENEGLQKDPVRAIFEDAPNARKPSGRAGGAWHRGEGD